MIARFGFSLVMVAGTVGLTYGPLVYMLHTVELHSALTGAL